MHPSACFTENQRPGGEAEGELQVWRGEGERAYSQAALQTRPCSELDARVTRAKGAEDRGSDRVSAREDNVGTTWGRRCRTEQRPGRSQDPVVTVLLAAFFLPALTSRACVLAREGGPREAMRRRARSPPRLRSPSGTRTESPVFRLLEPGATPICAVNPGADGGGRMRKCMTTVSDNNKYLNMYLLSVMDSGAEW